MTRARVRRDRDGVHGRRTAACVRSEPCCGEPHAADRVRVERAIGAPLCASGEGRSCYPGPPFSRQAPLRLVSLHLRSSGWVAAGEAAKRLCDRVELHQCFAKLDRHAGNARELLTDGVERDADGEQVRKSLRGLPVARNLPGLANGGDRPIDALLPGVPDLLDPAADVDGFMEVDPGLPGSIQASSPVADNSPRTSLTRVPTGGKRLPSTRTPRVAMLRMRTVQAPALLSRLAVRKTLDLPSDLFSVSGMSRHSAACL